MDAVSRGLTRQASGDTSGLGTRLFVAGGLVTLIVWAAVGFRFAREFTRAEQAFAAISVRYQSAQEALSTLRLRVVSAQLAETGYTKHRVAGGAAEDATAWPEEIKELSDVISPVLRTYEPIWDSPAEHAILARLRGQMAAPRAASLMTISEELQGLNRAMFIEQQSESRRVAQRAERRLQQGLGGALTLSLGICLFVALHARRLEARVRQQRAEEARYNQDLQRLSSRVVSVQEQERCAIARDLHDEVGQALAAIKVELAGMERAAAAPAEMERLTRVRTIADEAIRSVRDLSHLLHPSLLEVLGLDAALRHLSKEFSQRFGLRVDVHVDRLPPGLDRLMVLAVYRIVQEALANVGKHAHASRCEVRVGCTRCDLTVTISDNGVGIVPVGSPGALPVTDGLGLIGIRERAASFKGHVTIGSSSLGGAMVRVTLPIVFEPGEEREEVHERSARATG